MQICIIFKSIFSSVSLFLAFHFYSFKRPSTASLAYYCPRRNALIPSYLLLRVIKRHRLRRTGKHQVTGTGFSSKRTILKWGPHTFPPTVSTGINLPPFSTYLHLQSLITHANCGFPVKYGWYIPCIKLHTLLKWRWQIKGEWGSRKCSKRKGACGAKETKPLSSTEASPQITAKTKNIKK